MSYSGLFGLRFDKRKLQQPAWNGIATHHYSFFIPKDGFSFDFFADTGDGFDSTYSIARSLAQPCLLGKYPRPPLAIFGGDLVYPTPSKQDFMKRVVFPFNSALSRPRHVSLEDLGSTRKWKDIHGLPEMVLLPGNHDWFDGLRVFQDEVLDSPLDHFAGWCLTQQTSYFAYRLPGDWVILALDSALELDIDMDQFHRFCQIAANLNPKDRVIILTHEPLFWVSAISPDSEWPSAPTYSRLLSLIRLIGSKCRLLLSGDVHNYVRYRPLSSPSSPHLVICGGGGAFLHPTHFANDQMTWKNEKYELVQLYPSKEVSKSLSWKNVGNFRSRNLKFDIVGVILYFLLIYSVFPLCRRGGPDVKSFSSFLVEVFQISLEVEIKICTEGWISPLFFLIFSVATILFVPKTIHPAKRFTIGFLHALLHQVSAVLIYSFLILLLQTLMEKNFLPDKKAIMAEFPSFVALLEVADSMTNGRASILFMGSLDLIDLTGIIISSYQSICAQEISRFVSIKIHLLYFFVFSAVAAPVVSWSFGLYLFIADRVFRFHWDEAFSALSCADYKSFLRFRIRPEDGALECRVFGFDRVPRKWKVDEKYMEESGSEGMANFPSHQKEYPSKWVSDDKRSSGDPRVIETFVIPRDAPDK